MIFGFPEELFFVLVYCGVATIMAVVFGVLLYLVPSTGKTMLKARLKKLCVVFLHQKASIKAVAAKSLGPGWIETSEGKKLMAPLPPKNKEDWSPERDVIGKFSYIDGIPCIFGHESEILTANPETLYGLEAYCKGYREEKEIAVHGNPGSPKVVVPVSPKVLAEAVGRISPEELERFETLVIEEEAKRRMKGEWGPIIKIALILGMIFIAGLIVLLIAKGALGL